MFKYELVRNKAVLNIIRTKKFNDFMEPGPVDQVLDLSLCVFLSVVMYYSLL